MQSYSQCGTTFYLLSEHISNKLSTVDTPLIFLVKVPFYFFHQSDPDFLNIFFQFKVENPFKSCF